MWWIGSGAFLYRASHPNRHPICSGFINLNLNTIFLVCYNKHKLWRIGRKIKPTSNHLPTIIYVHSTSFYGWNVTFMTVLSTSSYEWHVAHFYRSTWVPKMPNLSDKWKPLLLPHHRADFILFPIICTDVPCGILWACHMAPLFFHFLENFKWP